jgi:hypothetical protein
LIDKIDDPIALLFILSKDGPDDCLIWGFVL